MKRDLVALVTGAAGGIGQATARGFAERGYRVVLADLDLDGATALATTLGPQHLAIAIDVSDEGLVRSQIAKVVEATGAIDVLVNNAALADTGKLALDETPTDFRRVVDVGLTGTFLMSQAVGRHMAQNGGGAIVNLCSIAGITAFPRRNAYSASKAAIKSLTQSMACELGVHGIRVNAVAPGAIRTAMFDGHAKAGRVDPARAARRAPLGRLGRPEEIADAICYLASPQASFITGTTLMVDGGWSAFGASGDAFSGELP